MHENLCYVYPSTLILLSVSQPPGSTSLDLTAEWFARYRQVARRSWQNALVHCNKSVLATASGLDTKARSYRIITSQAEETKRVQREQVERAQTEREHIELPPSNL